MKNFFMLLIAALFLATTPAQAQIIDTTIYNADDVADAAGEAIEKFYASLPKARGDYKSRQRPILIEGAMNIETDVFVHALKNPVAYRELNYLFIAGTYKNYPVVIVRTEQGMANSAASTALAIKKFNPIAVINQGTAGGHDSTLKIGDIVVATKAINYAAIKTGFSEAGAGFDFTKQEMRGTYAFDATTGTFQPQMEYNADTTLFNMAFAAANSQGRFNVVSGVIVSGDAWISCIDYINFLHERYGSSCEEMETAAAAQICHTAGIPFVGIRILSDNVSTNHDYDPNTGKTCQEFVLLVAENYINKILKEVSD